MDALRRLESVLKKVADRFDDDARATAYFILQQSCRNLCETTLSSILSAGIGNRNWEDAKRLYSSHKELIQLAASELPSDNCEKLRRRLEELAAELTDEERELLRLFSEGYRINVELLTHPNKAGALKRRIDELIAEIEKRLGEQR